jgi:SprT protein
MFFGNLFKSKPKVSPEKPLLDTSKMNSLLAPKVPNKALDYCVNLWKEHPFSFVISKTRNSCLGNYRFFRNHHTITINHDLNEYSFLITYIHEIAHQRVAIAFKDKRKKPLPHGNEWKQAFIELFSPVLREEIFPVDLYRVLKKHMENPKASSTSDHKLLSELRKFDILKEDVLLLSEIENDTFFKFKGTIYKKIENRRSRVLVQESGSKKMFTIPKIAEIEKLSIK